MDKQGRKFNPSLEGVLFEAMEKIKLQMPFNSRAQCQAFRKKLRKRLEKEMKHNETMIPVDDIVFTALESRRAGQEVNKVKKRLFEPEYHEVVPQTPETNTKKPWIPFYGQEGSSTSGLNVVVPETPDHDTQSSTKEHMQLPRKLAAPQLQFRKKIKAVHQDAVHLPVHPGSASSVRKDISSESEDEDRTTASHRKTNRLASLVTRLQSEVSLLRHRDAQRSRQALHGQISARAHRIVDNAIFEATVSRPDRAIDMLPISVIEEGSLSQLTKLSDSHLFSNVSKFTVGGELALGRTFSCRTEAEALRVACHELRCLKFLGKHINVIDALGLYSWETKFFSICTYCGDSLETSIKSHSWSYLDCRTVVMDLLSAMEFVHAADMLHNSLRPSCVYVDTNGITLNAVVGGFELACRQEVAMPWTPDQIKFLESEFTAPEVKSGTRPSKAADIYGFGAILNFLACNLESARDSRLIRMMINKCRSKQNDRPIILDLRECSQIC